jgi:hypothetical protein
MAVDFATPIAHQTGQDYSAFNNALAIGRPYRQTLAAANAAFAPGIEIFFTTEAVATLYAWLRGELTWQAAAATDPAGKLVLTVEPATVNSLGQLQTIEAAPHTAVYDNANKDAVRSALQALLQAQYDIAKTTAQSTWHPAMRSTAKSGSKQSVKVFLDLYSGTTADGIKEIVDLFFDSGRGVQVLASDEIGKAAVALATDQLPPGWTAARRMTFEAADKCGQPINPVYYLHTYMREKLLAAPRVNVLTHVVVSGALNHPLGTILPALQNSSVPVAREKIGGSYVFPLGTLTSWGSYTSNSKYEWRYANNVHFEARYRSNLNPIEYKSGHEGVYDPAEYPIILNRVKNLWADHGTAIATVAEQLQVPCEMIFGLIAAEAVGTANGSRWDPRSIRLEPLQQQHRQMLNNKTLELAYHHAIGVSGTITSVTGNADATSTIKMTLSAARNYGKLLENWSILFDDAEYIPMKRRVDAVKNSTDYEIMVADTVFKGGFVKNPNVFQSPGATAYYLANSFGPGSSMFSGNTLALVRKGSLRRLMVTVGSGGNTLDDDVTITLMHNGADTALTVTIEAGQAGTFSNTTDTVTAAANDQIAIKVANQATQGKLSLVTWTLQLAPVATTNAYLVDGLTSSVPDPIAGTVVAGQGLTWAQVLTINTATRGTRMSPGLMQALVSTAATMIGSINTTMPGIYALAGVTAPDISVPATKWENLFRWLLDPVQAIVAGTAYMRFYGYNAQRTRFELPLVGSAYNSTRLAASSGSAWGVTGKVTYPNTAARGVDASADFFDGTPAPTPLPSVRFKH